ncbi:MAG: 4Fe-4S dicluster domain-containing protein [Bacteroidales bacterium]|jgi:ferredoxin
MRSPLLRKFRIFVASIFFIGFFVVFADYRNIIPSKYINILVWLQFVPSVLKSFDLKSVIFTGFMAVLILTVLSGRTYCSFLCPLGIGQDLFSRVGGRIRRKFRRYGFKKPHSVIRYAILIGTLIVTVIWGFYLVTLLDPYSIFGRFMTFFAKPAVIVINNITSGVLHKFDIYTIDHIPVKGFGMLAYTVPTVFFLLIGYFSLAKGRLYCNMICPVGTFLGLISRISVLRIKFDESKCTKCGRCSLGCKSSCIDFLRYNVDLSRCVDCFDCIDNCPEKAISYGLLKLRKKQEAPSAPDPERRKFIAGSIAFLLGLPQILKGQDKKVQVHTKQSTVRENKTSPVCPPGAGSIASFNRECTACSLCINSCPNRVLQPAWLQYGITGMMQPVMDYHKGFCAYNCTKCTDICPTSALQPLVLEAKKLTQLGKVNFIKDNCVVKTEKTACGACSEACPTKAVYMVPYEGNLLIPETDKQICIGCGHCEFACPVIPYKAIYVNGNPVHLAAKKPVNSQASKPAPSEFPF